MPTPPGAGERWNDDQHGRRRDREHGAPDAVFGVTPLIPFLTGTSGPLLDLPWGGGRGNVELLTRHTGVPENLTR
jgi:hypothetical protein